MLPKVQKSMLKLMYLNLTGAETMVYSQLEDQDLLHVLIHVLMLKLDRSIELAFDMNKAHFFDAETEFRIR